MNFSQRRIGGTYISSGYEKALEIIEQRYNPTVGIYMLFIAVTATTGPRTIKKPSNLD